MNNKVLNFVLEAEKLKSSFRTGWKEVGIPQDRIESIADHSFGCMVLIIAMGEIIDYSNLDLLKVFKMIIVYSLSKVSKTERSILDTDDHNFDRESIINLTNGLSIQDELISIYDEAEALETAESKFALRIRKLESDIQAKKYELDGYFTLENAIADVNKFPDNIKQEILPQLKNASDGWILYDRKYYKDDVNFETLSKDIQNISE